MSIFGFGMAFGVTIAVGILFYIQVNKTNKEEYYFIIYWLLKTNNIIIR